MAPVMRMLDAGNEEEVAFFCDKAVTICRERLEFDPCEFAEIIINSVSAHYGNGSYLRCLPLVDEAINIYKMDPHRRAVGLWARGMVKIRLNRNRESYLDRKAALDLFQGQIIDQPWQAQLHPVPVKVWNLKQIHLMEIDLYSSIEFFHGLLMEDQKDLDLPLSITVLTSEIEKGILEGTFSLSRELIEQFLQAAKAAPGINVYPWGLVFCAVAAYEMQKMDLAVEYLSLAVHAYLSSPQQQGICLWMLGLAQWESSHPSAQAVQSMQNGLDIFSDLLAHAATNQDRQRYKHQILRMQSSLIERMGQRNINTSLKYQEGQSNELIPTIR